MKYFILLLSLALFSCNAQEKNCSKFKTGTFRYTAEELNSWTIIRTEKLQIEKNSDNGIIIKSAIEWKDDCTYTLTYKEVSNSSVNNVIGKKIVVEILDVNGNKYICQAVSDVMDAKLELIKVE